MNLLIEVKAEQCRRSLHEYVRQAWPIVEPGRPFIDNWHIGAISEHLQAATYGQINRLVINMPPGHMKSLTAAVFWPSWVWTFRPTWRALFGSYAIDLSLRDAGKTRDIIESKWYKDSFSNCRTCGSYPNPKRPTAHDLECTGWALSSDQNVKSYYKNTKKGDRLSISVGSRATGFRGDAVGVDDPLNVADARSDVKLEEAIYWWDRAMSSRLNDLRAGLRLIMMQRLHENDLSGHVFRSGGYEVLCLPSLFDTKRRSITFITRHDDAICELKAPEPTPEENLAEYSPPPEDDLLKDDEPLPLDESKITCSCPREEFWHDPRQRDGELLFRRLFPAPVIAQAKKDLRGDFAGQHQQLPAPDDGQMFKKHWWRFWKKDGTASEGVPRPDGCWKGPAVPLPSRFNRYVLSLDAAFKDLDSSDWVVFQVWGAIGADRYLLDSTRAHRGLTATEEEFKRLVKKWPLISRKYVEDKANGTAVIERLQRKIPGIIAVEPKGGKEARAAACTAEVESGNVFLPDAASWLQEFIDEFTKFPNGKHDDQVDCLSQALNEMAGRSGVARARMMVGG